MEKDELDNHILRIFTTEKIKEYMELREDKDHKFIEELFMVLKDSEIQELDKILFSLMDNIEKQSLKVDLVSGATVSSNVILKAIEKALNKR